MWIVIPLGLRAISCAAFLPQFVTNICQRAAARKRRRKRQQGRGKKRARRVDAKQKYQIFLFNLFVLLISEHLECCLSGHKSYGKNPNEKVFQTGVNKRPPCELSPPNI